MTAVKVAFATKSALTSAVSPRGCAGDGLRWERPRGIWDHTGVSRHAVTRSLRERARSGHLAAAATAAGLAVAVSAVVVLWPVAIAVVVACCQLVLLWAWLVGTGVPGHRGGLALGVATVLVADVALWREHGDGLAPLVVAMGAVFPLLLLHQLLRGPGRDRVTDSMAGVAAATVAAATMALYLEMARSVVSVALAAVLAVVVGLFAASVVDAVVRTEAFAEGIFHSAVGVAVSAAAGAAVAGYLLRTERLVWAVLLGAAVAASAGLVAVGGGYLARSAVPRGSAFAPAALPALRLLLPLAAAAPVAYLFATVVVRS